MLRRTRRRRITVAVGVASTLGALALALPGLTGLDAPTASARTARESAVSPLLVASADALGAAVGDSALGLQTPYYEPPRLAEPSEPGYTVASGADQPDPFVYVQGGEYYLFTSQDDVPQNVPVRAGPTMGQWGVVSDALPDAPPWSVPGKMWAPDVAQFGNHYVLYFTSQLAGVTPSTMCIGDAVSTAVTGPYLASPTPFICQQSLGGSIDPRVFVDRTGQPYMIWKSDQNARADQPGLPTVNTQIWSQPLSADGLRLQSAPTVVMVPDEPWQNHIVEAPQLVLVHGEYWMLYSGGWFNQTSYAIGAARCAGPLGPCIDTSSTPLLASNTQGQGPGEESVFSNDHGYWLLYTPFNSTLPFPGPPRPVQIAHLGFGPDGPYLAQTWSTSSRAG
jgi:beta-xylosidase